MSLRYPGGLITKTPVTPSTSSAPGIWTLEQALEYIKAGTWPTTSDPYFEYVTLLLHGNGTNGAQNNTFLDSSTNAFSITRNGNTTQGSFSPFSRADGNWSNYFDGSGDRFTVSTSTQFSFGTGAFTIEGWLYITAAGDKGVFQQGTSYFPASTTNTVGLGLNNSGTTWQIYAKNTNTSSTATYSLNTWTHFALVRSNTTTTLYINGTAVITLTSDSTDYTGQYFGVGTWYGTGYDFAGYISNLRVVKGTAVYTGAFTPPTSPLTAITNTSLLTCQSNRFIDNSTNAFTVTTTGQVSVQVFNPFNPTTAYSTTTNGGSGYFDGSGDYLTVPDNAAFDMGTGDFTLETWVYITSIPDTTGQTIFGDVNGYQWYMYSRSSGNLEVGMETFAGGYSQIYTTNNYVKANQWAHIAVARQSGTLRIFVNGVQCTTTGSMPSSLNISATINIARSNYNNANFIYGYLSDLRVVKGTAVYTANFTPPTAPLTAISGTSFLMSGTNGGIFDNAAMNDLETVGDAQISTAQSKFGGGSMYFDGAAPHGYLSAPSRDTTSLSGDFTIEAWVYRNNATGVLDAIVCVGDYGVSTGLLFYCNASGQLSGFTSNVSLIAGGSVPATTWTHVAIVRSGTASGNTKLYVNGTSVGTPATNTSVFTGGLLVGASRLGAIVPQEAFSGYIDEVRISRYARYTANFTPPTAPFADK